MNIDKVRNAIKDQVQLKRESGNTEQENLEYDSVASDNKFYITKLDSKTMTYIKKSPFIAFQKSIINKCSGDNLVSFFHNKHI